MFFFSDIAEEIEHPEEHTSTGLLKIFLRVHKKEQNKFFFVNYIFLSILRTFSGLLAV